MHCRSVLAGSEAILKASPDLMLSLFLAKRLSSLQLNISHGDAFQDILVISPDDGQWVPKHFFYFFILINVLNCFQQITELE